MRKIGGIAFIIFALLLLCFVVAYSLPDAINTYNESSLPGGRTKGYAMGKFLAESFKLGVVVILIFLGLRMVRRKT